MMSIIVLVFSVALFIFYLQATCERILGRPFEDPLPGPIVEANALEFPSIRAGLMEPNAAIESVRLRAALESDFLALTYLLKHAANQAGRLSSAERLLTLYFRALSALVNLGQKPVLLRMVAVLEYFANVLGERAKCARFGACPVQG
jgi:hypothetical protein